MGSPLFYVLQSIKRRTSRLALWPDPAGGARASVKKVVIRPCPLVLDKLAGVDKLWGDGADGLSPHLGVPK